MPCCFSFEYNQKKYTCQFSKERTFYRHNGELYCAYHLPLSSPEKQNCTKDQVQQFYSNITEYIDSPTNTEFVNDLRLEGRIQSLCTDLSGVCFPRPINFSGTHFHHSVSFFLSQFDQSIVDFSQCVFHGEYLDFRQSRFQRCTLDFKGAQFGNANIDFRQAEFMSGEIDFSYSQFEGKSINFYNVNFGSCDVLFNGSHFGSGDVDFWNARFAGGLVSFINTTFNGRSVSFEYANFGDGDLRFDHAQFNCQLLDFSGAQFGRGQTTFLHVRFTPEEVNLSNTLFNGDRFDFSNCSFQGGLNLNQAKLQNGPIVFSHDDLTDIEYLSMKGAEVRSVLSFEQRNIKQYVDFTQGTFYSTPSFWHGRLPDDIRLLQTQFLDTSYPARDTYQKMLGKIHSTNDLEREKVEDIQYLQYLCRLNDPSITTPEKWVLLGYNAISKFGLSITRPILSFVFLTVFMYCIYFFLFLGTASLAFCEKSGHSPVSCIAEELRTHRAELGLDVLNFTLIQSVSLFHVPSPHDPSYCENPEATSTKNCRLLVPHLSHFKGHYLLLLKLVAIAHSVLNSLLLVLFFKGIFWWFSLQIHTRYPHTKKLA